MKKHSVKYLTDVLIAIDLIEEFVEEIQNFTQYCSDYKTQSAVERQLAIIGEAMNQFKKKEPNLSISKDQSIISFRNRLVHAYDGIDHSIVWAIIKNHLEPLKVEVTDLKLLLESAEDAE